MEAGERVWTTIGFGAVQRRVRSLVPAPIRRADLAVFRAVARARLPDRGRVLPRLSKAADRSLLWIAIAGSLGATRGRFGRRAAGRGLLAIGVTSAVTNLPAKLLTGRRRPDLSVVPEIRRLARVPTSTSFPSGHAASAFAFATGASLELPAARAALFPLAAAVAASRVTSGVHYPGDVLAGAAIGAGLAVATTAVWPLADRRPADGAAVDDVVLAAPDGTGVVIVANTGAGNVLTDRARRQLLDRLPGARVLAVEAGEELPAALQRAARDARVLAVAGGDGSVSTAATVAHEAGLPLAVVAAGTLNHLAGDLGVEQVADTARGIREGRAIRMDLGEIDGHLFVNAASVGAYPEVVRRRERLETTIGKWPAAMLVTLQVMATHRPVEVEIDGRQLRVWQLFLGNGTFEADGIAPTRRRHLADGVLDVRLLRADLPWSRTRVVVSILLGRRGRGRAYERWFAEEVEVRSLDGPLRIARDGEVATAGDRFVVRKRPGALVVVQPTPDPPDAAGSHVTDVAARESPAGRALQ